MAMIPCEQWFLQAGRYGETTARKHYNWADVT